MVSRATTLAPMAAWIAIWNCWRGRRSFNFSHMRRPMSADTAVLQGIAAALRPGGRCAVSAFSSYFQVRWLEETDTFDAAGGVNHERTELLDADGERAEADLWTTCYTPRELRLVAERAGLLVERIWSVTPGGYAMTAPTIDTYEFLLVARSPPTQTRRSSRRSLPHSPTSAR